MENIQPPDTEAKILQAAEQIFMRDGFDGARMQVISETAGINKALLHYYFRSKQKLFEQVLEGRLAAFMPRISASFAAKATTAEKLEAFVDAYLKVLGANPHLPLFVLFSIHRNPAFVQRLPKTIFRDITAYFRLEIESGRMKQIDPAHFLISIVSMCVFPFAARHVISHMMDIDQKEYEQLLSQRKTEIMKLINSMLIP
jgi:AcrR family transcriptional regulator